MVAVYEFEYENKQRRQNSYLAVKDDFQKKTGLVKEENERRRCAIQLENAIRESKIKV